MKPFETPSNKLLTLVRDASEYKPPPIRIKASAATVVKSRKSVDFWNALLECWEALYVGYQNVIRLDQEACFTAGVFKDLETARGIHLKFSGPTSHRSLGAGEKYHHPLRRVFYIIRKRLPKIDTEVVVKLPIKGLNDTVGTRGLDHTMLVFVTLLTMPVSAKDLPGKEERMTDLRFARTEAAKIAAETRISRALESKLPLAYKLKLTTGRRVRVLDEVTRT